MAGLKLKRFYTKEGVSPYDMVQWRKTDVLVKDKDGATVFAQTDVEVPEQFSDMAAQILASKYFRSNISALPAGMETSFREVVHRIVNMWVIWGIDGRYFDVNNASIFYDEMVYMMLTQKFAPNSPQFFNSGLASEYNVRGDAKGNYYWDDKKGCAVLSEDSYTRSNISACYILNINDSLFGDEGIYPGIATEALIFHYGSGAGANFSKIRAANESLSNGGSASGVMSFLKVYDASAGVIKSGGKNRRAATMRILDEDHPDILDFIGWKGREEDKAKALIREGYDSHFDGEAYRTVSGQNSNNSVRLTDEFMLGVQNDQQPSFYHLKGRVDSSKDRRVSRNSILDAIAEQCWKSGDPGVQFHDIINDWNTIPNTDKIYGSNPCSEYFHINNTSCNLASINLLAVMPTDAPENWRAFEHCCELGTLALEISVSLGQYPTAKIAEWTYKTRSLGLGFTNLGGLLMSRGVAYDSDMGRHVAGEVTSTMTACAYLMSGWIAQEIGAFHEWEKNKYPMAKVIGKHAREANAKDFGSKMLWDIVQKMAEESGFRNSVVTLIAPVGTIGLLMDSETLGVEPEFSLVKYKYLAGGGMVKMANRLVEKTLYDLGYPAYQIKSILAHIDEHGDVYSAQYLKQKHTPIFETANGKNAISWRGHIKMLAAVQPNLSMGISKTVNMPNHVPVETIKEAIKLAWQLGVKSVALYRDGSKGSQPLVSKETEDKNHVFTEKEICELNGTNCKTCGDGDA